MLLRNVRTGEGADMSYCSECARLEKRIAQLEEELKHERDMKVLAVRLKLKAQEECDRVRATISEDRR